MQPTECSVCGRGGKIVRGYCATHYSASRRGWTKRLTPDERFTASLAVMPSGCIEWTKELSGSGYGRMSIRGVRFSAHRLAWAKAHGPIPAGMQVLHRCDNRPCCNVDHLFLGTNADNMADRDAKGRTANERKTHCPAGHEYNEQNTYYHPRGDRHCRVCKQARRVEARRLRSS